MQVSGNEVGFSVFTIYNLFLRNVISIESVFFTKKCFAMLNLELSNYSGVHAVHIISTVNSVVLSFSEMKINSLPNLNAVKFERMFYLTNSCVLGRLL